MMYEMYAECVCGAGTGLLAACTEGWQQAARGTTEL